MKMLRANRGGGVGNFKKPPYMYIYIYYPTITQWGRIQCLPVKAQSLSADDVLHDLLTHAAGRQSGLGVTPRTHKWVVVKIMVPFWVP